MKISKRQTIIIAIISLLLGAGIALTACKSKKKKSSTEEEIDNTNYISAPQGVVLKTPVLAMSFVKTPTFTVQGVESGDTVSLYKDAHCTAVSMLGSGVVGAEETEIDITIDPLTDPGAYAIFAKRANAQGASRCSAQLNTYQLVGCPNEFYIPIEGNPELGTSAFCIMKTEAKQGENNLPVSQYEGSPWLNILPHDAKLACRQIPIEHGYCNLISNPQWMTVARDIEATAANWSGGEVGNGFLNLGHSNYHPDYCMAIDDPTFPYDDWGESLVYKRTHVLSNGEVIWDLAGNAAEIIDWETGGIVYTVGPLTCLGEVSELNAVNCPALQPNDYMPGNPAGIAANNYTGEQYNLGKFYGTNEENRTPELGGAAYRGGNTNHKKKAGIFRLDLNHSISDKSWLEGFRCGCVVTGNHHDYQGLLPPSSVILKTPTLVPSFSKTPTFTVGGVEAGDTIRLYYDGSCHENFLMGQANVAPGATSVDITSSTLPAAGNYKIYANRTNAAGTTSICSTELTSYQVITCPNEMYVPVNGNAELGTTDFCVMKTEAKWGYARVQSSYEGNPKAWVEGYNAISGCKNHKLPNTTCSLISNAQWMTIARDIEATAANWSGGAVGSGSINRGHSDGDPNNALSISDPTDPWDQTDPEGLTTPWSQKRTHILSNGGVIWDFAGNLNEWVNWEDDPDNFVLGPDTCHRVGNGIELYQANCADVPSNTYLPGNPAGIPSNEYISATYGIGQFAGVTDLMLSRGECSAVHRGGCWYSENFAGIFGINFNAHYDHKAADDGFRCVCRTFSE